MKTLLTLSFFICICIGLHAQGNLQFNRALFVEVSLAPSSTAGYPTTQQTLTVPAGKVWKIESANSTDKVLSGTGYHSLNNAGNLILNDKVIAYFSSSTQMPIGTIFPIWLPAGTYTLILEALCSPCSTTVNYYGYISGIEFNITQ